MRIHGSLTNEFSPELAAMLRPGHVHGHRHHRHDDHSASVRKQALQEVGKALGMDFKGITEAVRAMLAKASSSGEDGVPAVIDALNKALDKAGEALKSSGVSDEQVASALGEVREQLGSSLAANAEQSLAQTTVYARKDKASLSIQTQEGDQVRIRFASRSGFAAQDSTLDGGEERQVYGFASGRVEISVAGELNDDELAAIGELVDQVQTLANDFFAGDIQKAFEEAAQLGFDQEQIAGFALKLSSREMLRQSGPATALPKPVVAPPAPVPAKPPVVEQTLTPDAAVPVSSPVAADASVAESPVAAAAEATPPAAVAAPIGDFLKKIFDLLSQPATTGRFEFSVQWKVRLVIDAVKAVDPAPKPTPGTSLMTQSVATIGDQLGDPHAPTASQQIA